MAWPKGRPRPKKVGSNPPAPSDAIEAVQQVTAQHFGLQELEHEPSLHPSSWRKGALLNVRNYGAEYIITLHPEEYDPEYPERSMRFTNLGECQNFVSNWYAREAYDPRAR